MAFYALGASFKAELLVCWGRLWCGRGRHGARDGAGHLWKCFATHTLYNIYTPFCTHLVPHTCPPTYFLPTFSVSASFCHIRVMSGECLFGRTRLPRHCPACRCAELCRNAHAASGGQPSGAGVPGRAGARRVRALPGARACCRTCGGCPQAAVAQHAQRLPFHTLLP